MAEDEAQSSTYLDGSTEFVVDENWLQAEHERGGDHEWTGETHFDCDFDQINEDQAEIYECEEYEPEGGDEADFVPADEVEVEETSCPARRKEGTGIHQDRRRSEVRSIIQTRPVLGLSLRARGAVEGLFCC